MAGPIQYAVTVDGVRIAFSASGTGRPLVYMPPIPFRHVEREWHLPEDRRWLARLERRVRLVRYDPRGLGLSVRGVKSFDLDALVRDLEAVVAAAAGDEVALFACVNTAPIAVAYALAHPGRVSHLILWCPVARMADSIAPQIGTLLELAEKDWELFTETAAHVMVGWSKGEEARRYADYLRACVTPDVARAFVETLRSVDVTERLQEVPCADPRPPPPGRRFGAARARVGARCAGASLAAHLGRAGVSVALLDAAALPSDQPMSTHLVQPRGTDELDRLGVGDRARAISPALAAARFDFDGREMILRYGSGRAAHCLRRNKLDQMLQEAAVAAGADLQPDSRVVALARDVRGRVVGADVRRKGGRLDRLVAGLVVGADGRRSTVARLVGAEEYLGYDGRRAAYWAYWRRPPTWDPGLLYSGFHDEHSRGALSGRRESGGDREPGTSIRSGPAGRREQGIRTSSSTSARGWIPIEARAKDASSSSLMRMRGSNRDERSGGEPYASQNRLHASRARPKRRRRIPTLTRSHSAGPMPARSKSCRSGPLAVTMTFVESPWTRRTPDADRMPERTARVCPHASENAATKSGRASVLRAYAARRASTTPRGSQSEGKSPGTGRS